MDGASAQVPGAGECSFVQHATLQRGQRVSPKTHSLRELELEPEKPIPEPSSCLGGRSYVWVCMGSTECRTGTWGLSSPVMVPTHGATRSSAVLPGLLREETGS